MRVHTHTNSTLSKKNELTGSGRDLLQNNSANRPVRGGGATNSPTSYKTPPRTPTLPELDASEKEREGGRGGVGQRDKKREILTLPELHASERDRETEGERARGREREREREKEREREREKRERERER